MLAAGRISRILRAQATPVSCVASTVSHSSRVVAAPPHTRVKTTASSARSDALTYWKQLWSTSGGDVFTEPEANSNLDAFYSALLPDAEAEISPPSAQPTFEIPEYRRRTHDGRRVFIPLCGRSQDLAYFADKGLRVFGLDAVAEPLAQFARDYMGGLEPVVGQDSPAMGAFVCRHARNLTLLHGDVFELLTHVPALRGGCAAVWDRAALTSIAEGDRLEYAAILRDTLRPGGRLLLEFMSSNLHLEGAIQEADALQLLQRAGFVGDTTPSPRVLQRRDVRALYPSFLPPGLESLDEVVVLARRPLA